MLLQRYKKTILGRLVVGYEKWIYYKNPKSKKVKIQTRKAGLSQLKQNIISDLVMLREIKGTVLLAKSTDDN